MRTKLKVVESAIDLLRTDEAGNEKVAAELKRTMTGMMSMMKDNHQQLMEALRAIRPTVNEPANTPPVNQPINTPSRPQINGASARVNPYPRQNPIAPAPREAWVQDRSQIKALGDRGILAIAQLIEASITPYHR